MQLFFILWMFILPIVAILLGIIFPIFWFLIVPKFARRLTWERFRKISYHVVADDSGYAYILSTKEEFPEGVVNTKKGYRFLPRPSWMKGNPKPKDDNTKTTENVMLRKFMSKDLGKPLWFGYVGKVASANPATLGGLQQTEGETPDAKGFINKIKDYVKNLAKDPKDHLTKMLTELEKGLNFKPLTLIDPTKIKELFPKMYTPSQVDALATACELLGAKNAGKQYTGLILGIGLILAMVLFIILALTQLT